MTVDLAAVCGAKLHLILPGENEPSVFEECDKTPAHRSYHGTLGGYNWHTYDPRAEAAVREQVAQEIEAMPEPYMETDGADIGWSWAQDAAAKIARGVR